MYIKDGIAYAGELKQLISVIGLQVLPDYNLIIRFSNYEKKRIDFKPYFKYEVFKPLKDKEFFKKAYIDLGTVVWGDDGEIDIDPEELYKVGIPIENFDKTSKVAEESKEKFYE